MQKENTIKKIPNEFLKQISGGGNSGSSFKGVNDPHTGYGVTYTEQHRNGTTTSVTGGRQGVQLGVGFEL